mmetsp:Transcript_115715/g.367990  ORF Transcript_115715/g.367990 Transcript_115715/m.367990 type:complete len:248 (+) Transcript_115715:494-1237(+)
MHAVVAGVGLAGKTQLLPLLQDRASQRFLGGGGRVRGAQDLAAEVRPIGALPLHHVVVDGGARCHELGAHGHEKTVEDVEGAHTLLRQLATVEAAAELDELVGLLALGPHLVDLLGVDLELGAAVHGVQCLALLQHRVPILAKFLLELVLGDGKLVRRQNRGLGRDGVVVLVDLLELVDLLGLHGALLGDGDAILLKGLLDEVFHLVGHGMGLDEDECAVPDHTGPSRKVQAPLQHQQLPQAAYPPL